MFKSSILNNLAEEIKRDKSASNVICPISHLACTKYNKTTLPCGHVFIGTYLRTCKPKNKCPYCSAEYNITALKKQCMYIKRDGIQCSKTTHLDCNLCTIHAKRM
uniref:Uncharacterized protein n=1 Tax=Megaviridae environmental sample TaxID=1737588 RepID=A0A5J6VJA1_9VIRU|nr:MAG: hypothetical protein [Megaviridae environmental sample]